MILKDIEKKKTLRVVVSTQYYVYVPTVCTHLRSKNSGKSNCENEFNAKWHHIAIKYLREQQPNIGGLIEQLIAQLQWFLCVDADF